MNNKVDWIGVDYGSKLAGTTAICFVKDSLLCFKQCDVKVDADQWLMQEINILKPHFIYLDAPLSLPAALLGKDSSNYFYRTCDVETKAMSPMFLGGLTARAIKLKDNLNAYQFIETYPGYLIRFELKQKEFYTKKLKINNDILMNLKAQLPYSLENSPSNWHQFDALACWLSGYRKSKGTHKQFGEKTEGLIIV